MPARSDTAALSGGSSPVVPAQAWILTAEQVVTVTGSDGGRGLSGTEVERRQREFGRNELAQATNNAPWVLLVRQFTNTMILVLAVAAAITYFVGDRTDTVVIGIIVVLNAAVGFVQEYRAERAMDALDEMTETSASVLRDGQVVLIPAHELVPGDVVRLAGGDVVPADLRLIGAHGLQVDEAALTGESETVTKSSEALEAGEMIPVADRVNMTFRGTAIARGRGTGVVVATGMMTEIGRIAAMLGGQRRSATPLQRRLALLGRRMAAAATLVCALVFVTGLLRDEPVEEMFITSVSLAVAAIPEGLPAVVTVALALGARRMAAHRALARRLAAVETLGSVTVICTDKTGTLTQNRMAVERVWTPTGTYEIRGVGYDPSGEVVGDGATDDPHLRRLADVAAVCNDAELVAPAGDERWQLVGEPTEGALLTLSVRLGVDLDQRSTGEREHEIPFDAGRRRMSTVHRDDAGMWLATKGALDALAPLLDATDREALARAERAAIEMASDGYRILALADRRLDPAEGHPATRSDGDLEDDLRLVGLVGIADPPRPEVADAVARCRGAGITPVMITGDHPATAVAIGRRLGLIDRIDGHVLTGAEVDELDDEALADRIDGITVYARTSPEQKLRIVDAWRSRGAVVAMTGDGVNDAPALRRADIGVAMGITGTDVSKEAADLVLADDNFATIVRAVEEGRRIYDNIRRFVRYLLTTNSGEIILMLVAPLLGLPVPLAAAQILWINLVTDGLPAVALGVERAEADTMDRPPRDPQESILGRGLWQHAVWVGMLIAGVAMGIQAVSRELDWPWPTMVFTTVALMQLGHALAVRSERQSLFRLGLRSNPWLLAAVLFSVALQMATVYVPGLHEAFDTQALTPLQLLVVAVASSAAFVGVEIEKSLRRRSDRVAAS